MICKNYRDLEDMIIQYEVKPLRNKISGEEYQKLWSGAKEQAKNLWKNLIKKNKRLYERFNYLDIEYVNGKFRRKPLKRGQPPKDKKVRKDRRIVVRIDDRLEEKLNDYCAKYKISISEAIRRAIELL